MAPQPRQGLPSPKTMRAWTHIRAGLPSEVLHLSSDIPIPATLKPDEVLIKISHAALNPGASVMLQLIPMFFRTKPSIPELDFSGTIAELGSSVASSRKLSPGTRVFGSVGPLGQHVNKGKGALAEYVVLSSEQVYPTPEGMKDEEAAGLGVAGCSALAYLDIAKIKEGERVLVNGASGGVGSLLVQMVKNVVGSSGHVVAVCSGRNEELVRGLGADEVIDYREHAPVHKYLTEKYSQNKFDWVLDAYGIQDLWFNCPSYLKPGKPFLSIGIQVPGYKYSSLLCAIGKLMSNMLWPRFLGGVDRSYAQVNGIANSKAMERLARMVDEWKLKVPIDSVWSFEDVLQASSTLFVVFLANRCRHTRKS
ncbi:related to zinc-binding oxidoreductase [Phialocephala subalpina]|uniref:Related to zinc-binding oxidoreductase n=1 Tax=Phialocephala subalpina TaxID=576137 RepID=A0A1L7WTW5_9HELO|nr:related to zinc-binding oxidoreductase [Phialocephala subalpina]